MLFAVGIALFVVSIVLHELAHWYEMERHGLRVAKAGLGIPIPYLTLKFTVMRRGKPVVLTLSPFLIGAYVQPEGEAESLLRMPYRTVADIAGAGPIAHFVIAFVMLAIIPFFGGFAGLELSVDLPFIGVTDASSLIVTGVCLLAALATWRFRSFLSAYVLPVVGILGIVLLAHVVLKEPAQMVQPENGGPVAVGRMIHGLSQDFLHVLAISISLNLGIGFLNALPLGPTDGGQIFDAAIRPRFPRFSDAFFITGMVLILGLVGLAFANDVRSLF